MNSSNILFTDNILQELVESLKKYRDDKIFVITDDNTYKYCYPAIREIQIKKTNVVKIPAGEKSKNLPTAQFLWNFLIDNNADRKSVVINLGGGMITDLGGFVASTFKRGIDFINIPTSILAMVDASVGGKNGVNFNHYKNFIGTFNSPKQVLICTDFIKTLPQRHIISGLSEVVKHALLSDDEKWAKVKNINPEDVDFDYLKFVIHDSVKVKEDIVEKDPEEKGIRQALNFGHTVGHAIETFLNNKGYDVYHGEAIAIGLIVELFISNQKFTFPFDKLFEITEYLATYFPSYNFDYDDYEELYSLMKKDKKNTNNQIIFTLLEDVGKIKIEQTCSKETVFEALNFYFQVKK